MVFCKLMIPLLLTPSRRMFTFLALQPIIDVFKFNCLLNAILFLNYIFISEIFYLKISFYFYNRFMISIKTMKGCYGGTRVYRNWVLYKKNLRLTIDYIIYKF